MPIFGYAGFMRYLLCSVRLKCFFQALCTEAALNAIQRRYPQIYKSNDRLLVKPENIGVQARDFMISVKSELYFANESEAYCP